MQVDNFIEFQNRFRSLKNVSRLLLKPILKNPKFNFFYTIANNWSNIVTEKYVDYCYVQKVSLDKENRQGKVYLISFNSAVSFYLNNNKQYIIEKINTLFGYNATTDIFIKEIPTFIHKKSIKQVHDDIEIELPIDVSNNILKQSLLNLAKSIKLDK